MIHALQFRVLWTPPSGSVLWAHDCESACKKLGIVVWRYVQLAGLNTCVIQYSDPTLSHCPYGRYCFLKRKRAKAWIRRRCNIWTTVFLITFLRARDTVPHHRVTATAHTTNNLMRRAERIWSCGFLSSGIPGWKMWDWFVLVEHINRSSKCTVITLGTEDDLRIRMISLSVAGIWRAVNKVFVKCDTCVPAERSHSHLQL